MSSNLKRMISYYKPYKAVFLKDMFFAMLSALIALTIPLVVRYVTSTVIYMETDKAWNMILIITVSMTILVLIQAYCNYYIANYGHVMGARMEYDMRRDIFAHYQKLSFSFYDNQKVGQLMSRITSDLFDITELLHHGPENIVISVIKIAGAFIILFNISGYLTLAAFILVPLMLIYAYFFNKRMKAAFRQNRIKIADINAQIEDNLSGIRVVKSFANERAEREKFKNGNDRFLEAKKNSYKYMGGYQAGLTAFTTMINVCVIVAGGICVTKNIINVTDMVTFLLYINVFTEPVKTLVDFTEQFQNGYSGFERFMEILNIEPDIKDSESAKAYDDIAGDVEFDNVCFSYNEGTDVLKNVSFKTTADSYTALVGPSGAGKSTLCSLIPRFYDVDSGRILIDGHDIRDITLKSLRENIGVVQQDVYLFAGTIFDNIAYGRFDASYDDVIEAAKKANAHEFIMSLPDEYNTDIGQRGVKLSGGQKQRISIARVFLKNPSILIFDEATSALDNESERVVQESLEKLAENRTTFVIAHRLSTIRNAKNIMVLTEDGIAEQGSHNELIEKDGIYKKLYDITVS